VIPEHAPFARDVTGKPARYVEQVAGVGVPGDQPERPVLAAAADQDLG
jgi:hypothetical protein